MKAALTRAAARNISGWRWVRRPVSEPHVPELTSRGTPLKNFNCLTRKEVRNLKSCLSVAAILAASLWTTNPAMARPPGRSMHFSASAAAGHFAAHEDHWSAPAWRHDWGRHDHDWDRDGHHRDFVIWNNQPFIVEDTRTTGVGIIRRRFTAGPSTTSRSW